MKVTDTHISCPLGLVHHLSYGIVRPSITYTLGHTEKLEDPKPYYKGRIVFKKDTVIIPAKHPLLVFEQPDSWYIDFFDMSATIVTLDGSTKTDIFKNVFVAAPQKLPSGEYSFNHTIEFTAQEVIQTEVGKQNADSGS